MYRGPSCYFVVTVFLSSTLEPAGTSAKRERAVRIKGWCDLRMFPEGESEPRDFFNLFVDKLECVLFK